MDTQLVEDAPLTRRELLGILGKNVRASDAGDLPNGRAQAIANLIGKMVALERAYMESCKQAGVPCDSFMFQKHPVTKTIESETEAIVRKVLAERSGDRKAS